VALGAATAGARSLFACKHVGLNVAMDPLMTASYTGILAGFVIVVCDDPGMHSSQNEQDTRWVALYSKMPMLEPASPAEAREFASELVEGTWAHREEIDQLISTCSENWSLERMARVDRNILRLAVYELLHGQGIPPKVALNEAIDLGKEFGSENSGSFINGILDALYSQLRKDHADQGDNGEPGPACS